MTDFAPEFRRCLIELDIPGVRRVWKHVRPDMPEPGTDAEVLATLHMARTACAVVSEKLRLYSHNWCLDHGYPSQLPHEIWSGEPAHVVTAVGIAVKSVHPEIEATVRGVMENAVLEAYAGKNQDPIFVRARMEEAKQQELRRLGLGRG